MGGTAGTHRAGRNQWWPILLSLPLQPLYQSSLGLYTLYPFQSSGQTPGSFFKAISPSLNPLWVEYILYRAALEPPPVGGGEWGEQQNIESFQRKSGEMAKARAGSHFWGSPQID